MRTDPLIHRDRSSLTILLFIVILSLGVFARVWEFRSLPPGLNQDEASSGLNAYDLLHFGVDRNGVSFPIISWGSGQNLLYAYFLVPAIALGGLSPFTVRLPMLIAGILTLPLVYLIGRRTAGGKFGLISMFLLAISPWHILLSRWGLDANILPFIFSIGFLFLLRSMTDNKWFMPAMLFLALCLYAYGTAYVAVPLFVLCALPVLMGINKAGWQKLLPGLVVFVLACAPIGLFLLVNARHWESIHLGPITIPELPVRPRYEAVSVLFRENLLSNLVQKLSGLLNLLWFQVDGHAYNAFEPFGYFYKYTLPVAILGAVLLIPFRKPGRSSERILMLAWLGVGLILGILQPVNINRINLLFIPLIFCVAYVLLWVADRSTPALMIAVAVFMTAFSFFTADYHGAQYRSAAGRDFFTGLLPAINFASQQGDKNICVTDAVNEPYIYVLFSQHLNPSVYLKDIVYLNPRAAAGQVRQLGRFSFGLDNCPQDAHTVYVLSAETPPGGDITYSLHNFGSFIVYIPNTGSN